MEKQRTIRVSRRLKDHKAPSGEPSLLLVPGEWAHAVVSLVKISEEHRYSGLIITNVGSSGEGARSGMARGDVLLRYDGVEIDNVETLRRLEKRHMDGDGLPKTTSVDSARGSEDVSFEVQGGRLGITVSPLLHQLKIRRVSRKKRNRFESMVIREDQRITVIQNPGEAIKHDPAGPALVEVPAELARTVLSLMKLLEVPGTLGRKKWAKSLLATARA